MSKFNIKTITAPKLNVADYGANINTQFNNIDANFQALANSDFFTGARGEGIKLIEVEPTSSNVFEFREDLEFRDKSIFEGSDGAALKSSIINAFKKYNPSNTTWYVGKKYVLYIDNDKKVHNIYPIIYISEVTEVDGEASQDNSYLDFEYINGILTLTESKGYPSLYYDVNEKKYCWLINGAKTGIVAQGKDGLNGSPGPGFDFDVIEIETNPLTNDGFYKINKVYWPKYHKMQKFYLDISSNENGVIGANSSYTVEDIEWLAGGRDEWINSYGSRTFLVSRTLIEYVKVDKGTGTHKKNDDGTYTPISGDETGDYVQEEIPVLHLCKLIHKSSNHIIRVFGDTKSDKSDNEDSETNGTTDTDVKPMFESSTAIPDQNNQNITIDKFETGIMAPVFSTVVSDETKQKFTEAYDNNKKYVNEISTGKVTSIQYVSDGNKLVEVSMIGSLGTQIQEAVAFYADDIYGVYLTRENMHMLTSLISSGSTPGVSLVLDDINWTATDNQFLRCLYLKDCVNKNNDVIPNSGILLYNSTDNNVDGEGNGKNSTLKMRCVGNVNNYRFGSNNRLDPDGEKSADNVNVLTLDLGDKGILKTGTVNTNALSLNDLTVGNSATIGGELTVGNSATIDGELAVGNSIITEKNLGVKNILNVGDSALIGANLTTAASTYINIDLTVGNSATTNSLGVINSIKSAPKTIQFVKYSSPTSQNSKKVDGTTGDLKYVARDSEANKWGEFVQYAEDNIRSQLNSGLFEKHDKLINEHIEYTINSEFSPTVNRHGHEVEYKPLTASQPPGLDIDNMSLVNVPEILFNIINSLYSGKTNTFINDHNNTTWVGENFELKIKYINMDISISKDYLYCYITGYIECFNTNSFNQEDAHLNKLNIDTPVRMEVTGINRGSDFLINSFNDLSLKICNNKNLKWGMEKTLALPYICVYPGTGYNDIGSRWYITSPASKNYSEYYLAKGRVNINSVNGPYLIDSCYPAHPSSYGYRSVHSAWITTTYYKP